MSRENVNQISEAYHTTLEKGLGWPDDLDWNRIFDACRLAQLLEEFEAAVKASDDEQIAWRGQRLQRTANHLLMPNEIKRIKKAQERIIVGTILSVA